MRTRACWTPASPRPTPPWPRCSAGTTTNGATPTGSPTSPSWSPGGSDLHAASNGPAPGNQGAGPFAAWSREERAAAWHLQPVVVEREGELADHVDHTGNGPGEVNGHLHHALALQVPDQGDQPIPDGHQHRGGVDPQGPQQHLVEDLPVDRLVVAQEQAQQVRPADDPDEPVLVVDDRQPLDPVPRQQPGGHGHGRVR